MKFRTWLEWRHRPVPRWPLPVAAAKADRTDPAIEPKPENPERSEREGVTQDERDALLEDGQ